MPNPMAPVPTPALVHIFPRSPEDELTRTAKVNRIVASRSFSFVQVGRPAHPLTNSGLGIGAIIIILILGLWITGMAYWCRARRRRVRLLWISGPILANINIP